MAEERTKIAEQGRSDWEYSQITYSAREFFTNKKQGYFNWGVVMIFLWPIGIASVLVGVIAYGLGIAGLKALKFALASGQYDSHIQLIEEPVTVLKSSRKVGV